MGVRTAIAFTVVLFSLGAAAPAAADPPESLADDGTGKRWRQLTETTGLTPAQIATVCPRDGETRCSGVAGNRDLSEWVWATGDQVHALLARYEPALLAEGTRSVSGPEYWGGAYMFLTHMRPTMSFVGYPTDSAFAGGWTSSTEEDGGPTFGSAGRSFNPTGGGIGVGPTTNPDPIYFYGVWMWRPSSDDITPPTITPTVSGTLGNNGWYTSDVSVTWNVVDAESDVSTTGCDAVTLDTDTQGTTFTCSATSEGGTASRSVTVTRDTTAPTVTCADPPQTFEIYQLGAWVRPTVTDATSLVGSPPAMGATNTSTAGTFTSTVTGTDRAGNRTTVTCTYRVVIPSCEGLEPTILGNAMNNVINGTAGRDVIQGMGGADTINGLGGDDVICGHDGPDRVFGGDGNDRIFGDASPDDLNGGRGNDYIDGGLHNDSIRGDDGRDTCISGEQRMSSCD
jgi:RTX calcium-binding nonapeptide repeat (4 copies)